jgi:biotin carboxyl carrier protein
VVEDGRKYKTMFTKKFAARKQWVRPNPEEIKSFIPGTVEKIMVKTGAYVEANEVIISYIAMKMRNVIRAPFAGKVTAILVKEGDQLPKGVPMLIIKQKQEISAKEEREARKKKREKQRQKKR